MFKFVLLLLAAAGLNARPLQYNALRIQNGGWVIGAPQLVQDGQEYMGSSGPAEHRRWDMNAEPQWKVVLAPEHTVKTRDDINRKAAPPEERRQGTEPSRRFLIDLNTGLIKEYVSEMDRRAEVYHRVFKSEFRQGTQNSRVTLVDVRTGQELPQLSEMERRAQPPSEFRQDTKYNEATVMKSMETVHKAALPEFLRHGTEPSRRILVNSKTGLVQEDVSEMQRRVSGFYNPVSNSEFRQGTQNSRVTLVDVRTGQELPQLSEMERRAQPPSEFRQDTKYNEATVMKSMETVHKAALPEFLRHGTEPSRRILVNSKTGLVLEHVSEMQRRVSGFYNPVSNSEFRQGTQNSRVTLVDVRTGQQLPQLSEMQRKAAPDEFRQGTEYHMGTLMNLRKAHTMGKVSKDKTAQEMETNEVFPEFKRGIQYSHAQRQHILDRKALESNEVVHSSPLEEFKRGLEYSHANIIH